MTIRPQFRGTLAGVLALVAAAGAAHAKPAKKHKPPPASAAPSTADPATSGPAAPDARSLFDTARSFEDVVPRIDFALHPSCDESLVGPEMTACKKTLADEADKARKELEGQVVRLEAFVQRREFDAARGVFDFEIGKGGILRARGIALDADVAVRPADAGVSPKAAASLADFGVKAYVVPSEKYKTEEDAGDSPLGAFTRGSAWVVVKVARVAALTPDCAKKPCASFPAVLVDIVTWGLPLGGGKALLDGKVVAEFGRLTAAPADVAAGPAAGPGGGTHGADVISSGPDKIDSMLSGIDGAAGDGGGGVKGAPVAGTSELSPADITRVIDERKWRLKKCASFGEGMLEYEFVVEVDGHVRDVALKTAAFKDKPLAKCAEKILSETVFPAHKGPPKKLKYPFIIR
ncbi:MAG TPA: hypothetical protein VG389_18690 [Myxococcota bacterium]|jgi:hypothetical protein|nr:hypothetical protein [Myxococcota bacterium]